MANQAGTNLRHIGDRELSGRNRLRRPASFKDGDLVLVHHSLSPRKLHPVFHLKGGICVQKKTHSFRVFPPENRELKNGGISNIFFWAISGMQVVRGMKKTFFFGMLSARGLAHSVMQNVYFPMVLNKQMRL